MTNTLDLLNFPRMKTQTQYERSRYAGRIGRSRRKKEGEAKALACPLEKKKEAEMRCDKGFILLGHPARICALLPLIKSLQISLLVSKLSVPARNVSLTIYQQVTFQDGCLPENGSYCTHGLAHLPISVLIIKNIGMKATPSMHRHKVFQAKSLNYCEILHGASV